LQSILAAVQSSGADGACELPESVNLPLKSVAELLNLERLLEDDANYRKVVSYSDSL